MSERIKKTFENKKKKLVTFTTGGDPDLETSFEILKTIINNRIDIVEIGMPFSDPMAIVPSPSRPPRASRRRQAARWGWRWPMIGGCA